MDRCCFKLVCKWVFYHLEPLESWRVWVGCLTGTIRSTRCLTPRFLLFLSLRSWWPGMNPEHLLATLWLKLYFAFTKWELLQQFVLYRSTKLRNCAGEKDVYCSANYKLGIQMQPYSADQIQLVFKLNFSSGRWSLRVLLAPEDRFFQYYFDNFP